LKGIDLTVRRGEVVVIIGPSGGARARCSECEPAGPHTEGQVFLEGEDLTQPRWTSTGYGAAIGMVFQQFNLFPL